MKIKNITTRPLQIELNHTDACVNPIQLFNFITVFTFLKGNITGLFFLYNL